MMGRALPLALITSLAAALGCGPEDRCTAAGARAQVTVAWEIANPPCDAEHCSSERSAPCSVSAIDEAGPIVVTLACMDPERGASTDTLTIDLEPSGAIDLEIGATVTVTTTSSIGFETGGSSSVRVLDEAGEVVVAAVRGERFGGGSDDTAWSEGQLQAAALPLDARVEGARCRDDDARNLVTIIDGEAEVTVSSGGDGILSGGAEWLVVVESARREPGNNLSETIDVAILRVR